MFDWARYLELAKELTQRASTDALWEAALRSAISRAYYASFCAAREYAVQNLGYVASFSAADHLSLRLHFRIQGGEWTRVANRLDDLRRWRNRCDYENRVPNLSNLTVRAITAADDIFAVLNR